MKVTDTVLEKLITLVQENPCLYDVRSNEHKDAIKVANIWVSTHHLCCLFWSLFFLNRYAHSRSNNIFLLLFITKQECFKPLSSPRATRQKGPVSLWNRIYWKWFDVRQLSCVGWRMTCIWKASFTDASINLTNIDTKTRGSICHADSQVYCPVRWHPSVKLGQSYCYCNQWIHIGHLHFIWHWHTAICSGSTGSTGHGHKLHTGMQAIYIEAWQAGF